MVKEAMPLVDNFEKVLVSVILTTYRRCSELRKSLTSIFNQTYLDIEVVLVDDNADFVWNQKVKAIITEYDFARANFTYIVNRENCGSADSRNIGIQAAKGEYVTFLDDDDVYLPEKVEKQLEFMLSTRADYCISDLYLYDENDRLADKRIRSYVKKFDQRSLLRYHLMHHMTGTDTLMFRKSYFIDIGGFPSIDVGDEFYLMERAILGDGVFAYLPGCHVKAYIHTETAGLSSGAGKIHGENILFEHKKTFFNQLDSPAIRYIKMRHYAVLAFAALRQKYFGQFALYSLIAFCCSPIHSAKLFWGRRG